MFTIKLADLGPVIGTNVTVTEQGSRKRIQTGPETLHTRQRHRFCDVAKLAQGQHLKQFVEGAKTPGECDEGIGEFDQARLADRHVSHHLEPIEAGGRHLALKQTLRNHANRSPARTERGIRHLAHHANMPAAKNQGPATLG